MKKILLLLIAVIVSCGVYAESKPISFTETVQAEGTQDELYRRAEAWFATTFVDANEVLQVEDMEAGQLIGRGGIEFISQRFVGAATVRGSINYIVKIFVKDGRYKYEMIDFRHKSYGGSDGVRIVYHSFGLITTAEKCPVKFAKGTTWKKWRENTWTDIKCLTIYNAERLIVSLKDAMSKPAEIENDDW